MRAKFGTVNLLGATVALPAALALVLAVLVTATAMPLGGAVCLAAEAAEPSDPAPPEPPPPAADKAYDVMSVDADQRKRESEVRNIALRAKQLSPEHRKQIEDYVEKYYLARWTQPENRAKLAIVGDQKALRRELRSFIESPLTEKEPHDYLNGVVLKTLGKIAAGNYHPQARTNAMLAIGELNESEPRAGQAPKPLPAALTLMLKELQSDKQMDAVRVTALVGIMRHARLKAIPAADPNFAGVTQAAVKIIEEPMPAGRTPEGHGWMQSQAADILGELGVSGANGAVAQALGKLIGDSDAQLTARRSAAKALGRLNMAGGNVGDAKKLAAALASLAVAVCEVEERGPASRKRLRERVVVIGIGLRGPDENGGVKSVASDADARKIVDALDASLKALGEAVDRGGDEATLVDKIGKQRKQLQEAIKAG